jgi:hypothetical protein
MEDQNERPVSKLEAYLGMDLTPEGPAGAYLLARAANEAENNDGTIELSAAGKDWSPHLTPEMSRWLNAQVSNWRGQALAEIDSQARKIRIGARLEGVVREILHDKAERVKANRHFEVTSQFNQKHKSDLENEERLREEYEDLRATLGGREAKVPNRWLEFGVLIPLILVPESLLNFESFRRAPIIQSDAMALGATLLVGLGIAAAAYCLGIYARQINYFMRPDDRARKRSGWPIYTFGILALLISLAAVAVARYYYLLPRIQEAVLLGETVPNVGFSIGSLLFGNLICFLLGAILTFFLNDENPEFSEKSAHFEKLKRRVSKAKHREVDTILREVDARAAHDQEAALRKDEQMQRHQGYSQLREQVARVQAKDQEVIGLMQRYRNELAQQIKSRSRDVMFRLQGATGDLSNPKQFLPADKFTGLELKLFWSN